MTDVHFFWKRAFKGEIRKAMSRKVTIIESNAPITFSKVAFPKPAPAKGNPKRTFSN
jgi:hypothetical protein